MRGGYVPVDEGEAEAQPAGPVLTIRLPDDTHLDNGNRLVEFSIEAAWGRKAALDALLHEQAVRYLQREDLTVVGAPEFDWSATIDGRVRTATYKVKVL